MTKEELLQQFTSDELREEPRRRAIEKRKLKEGIPRCRNCKYFGTIGYYGGEPNGLTQCCPYKMTKSKKHYLVLKPTRLACEEYVKRDEQ